MNTSSLIKKTTPHFIVLGIFILCTALYFYPLFFESKTLIQYDVVQSNGINNETNYYHQKHGEPALWTNSLFGGMPVYLSNFGIPGNWSYKLSYYCIRFFKSPADIIFGCLISFYILTLSLKIKPYLGCIGSIAFTFGLFNIVSLEAGHVTKILAIGYMCLVMAGLILLFKERKTLIGLCVLAIGFSMQLSTLHFQIIFYTFILSSIYLLSQLYTSIKDKTLGSFSKAILVSFLAILLGIGPNFATIWATYEYNQYSMRGKKELTPLTSDTKTQNGTGLEKEYAFSWSMGKLETFTFVAPYFYGGGSSEKLDKNSETAKELKEMNVPSSSAKQFLESVPMYWGDQPFTGGPIYGGITMVFLFILGLFLFKKEQWIWIVAAMVVFTVLAWGRNLESVNYFLFDFVPGFNKFRTVSMAVCVTLFCLPFLGIWAFNTLSNTDEKEALEALKKTLITSLSLIALTFVVGLTLSFEGPNDSKMQLPENILSAIVEDRKSLFRGDLFRSLLLILGMGGMAWAFITKKLNETNTLLILAVLVLFDLWGVGKRYLNNDNFEKNAIEKRLEMTEADIQIKKDTSLSYRVFNLQNPFNDAVTSYHHKSVGGYHGAKMQRYQDLIERQISKNNQAVLDMLNTKYLITGQAEMPVYQRPTPCGNAWFVSQVTQVKGADKEMEALTNFDPKTTAIIDISAFKPSSTTFEKDSSASITLTQYKPNHLIYQSTNSNDGLAVFSEIYYPKGWNVYIDGTLSNKPLMRANYVLRAYEIPKGTHKVELKFEPDVYYIGNKIALASSIVLFSIALLAIGLVIKEEIKK